MSRNVFENTAAMVTPEEALEYGDKLVALLPRLENGDYYQIVQLTAGTGIIKRERDARG
jgi:hypothetical protein